MGCITSLPTPVDQSTGVRPNRATHTVIIFGRSRLAAACGLADDFAHLENRQEHTDGDTANSDAEEDDEERFNQRSKPGQRCLHFFIKKVGNSLKHVLDFAGLLAGVGWVVAMFIVIALFEQRSWKYVAINCGYITVYFAVIGFILGIWR